MPSENPAETTAETTAGTAAATPVVDVVIAVHDVDRPVARAIESCASTMVPGAVRVTVVCHDISARKVEEATGLSPSTGLRYLEYRDGVRSPAGPKNRGLDAVEATFTAVLDSDDYLEPGAVDHWYRVLTEQEADVVVAPVRHQNGGLLPTPWSRFGRRHRLDPVKDGLAYSTAPRGMWRTATARAAGFRYTEGLRTGEDLEPGLRLAFSGARTEFPARGPKYVLCDDAEVRVTHDVLPLAEEFLAPERLDPAWLASIGDPARRAIATKLTRTNLLGALRRRGTAWSWPDEDRDAVQSFARRLRELNPAVETSLPAADQRLFAAACAAADDRDTFLTALAARQSAGPVGRHLTANPLRSLGRESALRHGVRLVLDRR
ncbi:glycosyltransferase family A protein [Tersicoccus sp. MR15.9]|uniref:glycosyltransferase family A protein n=1 Tax=Tersicoccus mangrovi TaxID=3121635 RepID=UPI002FE55342